MKNLLSEFRFRAIGIIFGIFIGAFLGAGTGIVGSFGGIKGIIVFSTIGGVLGFFMVPDAVRSIKSLGRLQKKVGRK